VADVRDTNVDHAGNSPNHGGARGASTHAGPGVAVPELPQVPVTRTARAPPRLRHRIAGKRQVRHSDSSFRVSTSAGRTTRFRRPNDFMVKYIYD
jgi:hypothetical protein